MRGRRQILVGFASLLVARTARGDECIDAPDPATCYFQSAQKLQATDAHEAARRFLASYRIRAKADPLAGYGTALANDKQFILAAEALEKAIEDYEAILAKLTQQSGASTADIASLHDRISVFSTTLAGVSPDIAHVQLRGDLAPGLTVARKDATDLRSANPQRFVVKPGGDTLVATFASGKTIEWNVTVPAGSTSTIDVPPAWAALPSLAATRVLPPAAVTGTRPIFAKLYGKKTMSDRTKTLGIAIGGAGVIALGAGIGFGLHARSQWDAAHADGHCDDLQLCDPAGVELASSARDSATIATIAVGTGVIGVGVATVLFLRRRSMRREPRSMTLAPHIDRSTIEVAVAGSW